MQWTTAEEVSLYSSQTILRVEVLVESFPHGCVHCLLKSAEVPLIKVVAKAAYTKHMYNISSPHVQPCFAFCSTVELVSYRKVVKGFMLQADRGQFPTGRDADLPNGVRRGPCTKTISH